MKKNVAVFREEILPYSETFISNQVSNIEGFNPTLVGFKKLRNSGDVPVQTLIFSNSSSMSSLRVKFVKLLGRVPETWISRMKESQFSIVHAHFGTDALWILPVVKRLNLPFVVTFHGYDAGFIKEPYTRSYRYFITRRGKIFNGADRIIAVSNFMKNRLLELGCPPEKITVHYIGIDLEEFATSGNTRELTVLSVGRLIERKGALDLIYAMSEVQKQVAGARLLLVGSGDMEEVLRGKAQELEVDVEFLGVKSPQEIRELMGRAAVFCLPSRDEAFGMVYAEAQAMELPVVAYANSGVNEAVVDGVTGLLSETGNIAQLSSNLIRLLENPPLRKEMGEKGRRHVEKNFDIRVQTRKLEGIYREVIGKRKVN